MTPVIRKLELNVGATKREWKLPTPVKTEATINDDRMKGGQSN